MKNKFEQLKVLQETHRYVLDIYKVTGKFPNEEKYGLTNQLRRAAVSVASNIVEGNERKTRKEYIQFLYTAKGSLAETKYQLLLAKDLKYLSQLEYEELIVKTNTIGKMINSLINYLKKPD